MAAPVQPEKPDRNFKSNSLRKELRARRRELSRTRQTANAKAVARHLVSWGIFMRCRSIALYHACDGELDPLPIANMGFKYKKQIYLPALRHDKKNALWFIEYRPGDLMLKNRFGIDEPTIRKHRMVPPYGLDLILLPLVGFDTQGNRLGMGGGYYDRTLAFLKYRKYWRRPMLLGMAHECQKLPMISAQSWDIPLDGIVSEAGLQLVDKKTS